MHPEAVDGKHETNHHPVKARLSKLYSREQFLREMQRTSRTRKDWAPLQASAHAVNTVNPIRRIVDAVTVAPNPNKNLIKLHLGDPTLSGALPPSKVAVDAIIEATTSHQYDGYGPAVGTQAAREAVASKYTHAEAPITADDVILASGCSHALQMAIEGLANPGDNILIPQPGFPLYSTLCRPHGVEDRAYKVDMANGGQIDLDYLETLIDERTQALIINNPGNPTGVVFSKEHLQDILALASRHRLVIIADEIYGDLTYDGAVFHPIATLSPKVPVITCDGIAKRWMVPGWRMGWLIVHDRYRVLSEVKKGLVALSQKIVGPCSLIQGALPKILRDTPDEFFEHNRRVISRNAGVITKTLKGVKGIHCLKPHGAMYMMLGVDKQLYGDDIQFSSSLIQEESVFCLPGSAFSSPGWIRLVLTQTEEIAEEAALRIRAFCERHLNNADLADVGESSDEGCDISNCESF
ncbi:tyrosine transaminase [Oesophagostomum dentatum]|uniref:Tyrosine aminotransferase n=1 Tax=Oesophagostomum dentatum TaxID=61180 RepID=A0A0B1T539_OESDE|nr:tyrosine transaminase [Oesophagostomum dentatum]